MGIPKTRDWSQIGIEIRCAIVRGKTNVDRIAARAGINSRTLYRRMTDPQGMTLAELARICEACGLDPAETIEKTGGKTK